MIARPILLFLFGAISLHGYSQSVNKLIKLNEVKRIETTLASDDMRGRKAFTPDIDKAADFIAAEFKKAGLQPWKEGSYFQEFTQAEPRKAGSGKAGSGKTAAATLKNVVGVLPGRSAKEEYVIFSGHYDHLGVGKPNAAGDSIYNGANDDAAGITAVIMLARYYAQKNNNERTLIFVAFTAEEVGGFGSRYFSRQLDPGKIAAMFNIEMIGTESKWGKNAAYITGYERTNMGEILGKNLEGSKFKFYPDPYPEQQLFFRSDNATLARQGVPAHTISTSKMDSEPYYHTQEDELETLDLKNMTEIIKAIALSASSIVNGTDTPSRVKME